MQWDTWGGGGHPRNQPDREELEESKARRGMGLQCRYRNTPGAAMTKDEILKKHKQYLFPSVFTYYADPLVTDRASMQHLWDIEGNKYLDFFTGIVTISVGHANPRVTSKIKAQVD